LTAEEWIQYGAMVVAITALILKWKGMKKFVAVGLFASFYANLWCFIAAHYHLWNYHANVIVPAVTDFSLSANFVVVPIIAMFWVRYCPLRFKEMILWAFLCTTVLTGGEVIIERFTEVLKYHSGYDWYYSYVLWFFSWFIWYGFHLWLNDWRRDLDSFFK